MGKLLLIFLFIASSFPVLNAQIKTDKIDDFTGERYVVTERVRFVDGRMYTLTAELVRKDGKDYIGCNFWAHKPFTMNKGNKLYLKFSDGTAMKAVCVEDVAPQNTGISIRERMAYFLCEPEDGMIEKMAESPVVRFRLETKLGDYEYLRNIEYDVKKRRANQMIEQAVAFKELLYSE